MLQDFPMSRSLNMVLFLWNVHLLPAGATLSDLHRYHFLQGGPPKPLSQASLGDPTAFCSPLQGTTTLVIHH